MAVDKSRGKLSIRTNFAHAAGFDLVGTSAPPPEVFCPKREDDTGEDDEEDEEEAVCDSSLAFFWLAAGP